MMDVMANRTVEEDDTLMAIYPRIKGIPEQRMKEHYRKELGKIHTVNKDQDETKKELVKLMTMNESALFNAENERAAKEDKEEKERNRKDLLMRNLET